MLTSSVSRNILKAGGLDAYIFKQPLDSLDEKTTWLRESIKNAHVLRKERGLVAAPELSERKITNKTEPWSREVVEAKRLEKLEKRANRSDRIVQDSRVLESGVLMQQEISR